MFRKHQLLILLCILVLIPISLLFWFSIQYQNNEELIINHQYQSLINKQLKTVDEQIKRYFLDRQSTIFQDIDGLQANTNNIPNNKYHHNSIRNYLNHSTYINNLYIENRNQEQLFPSSSIPLKQEQEFLQKLGDVLVDRSRFTLTPNDETPLNKGIQNRKSQSLQQSFQAVQSISIPQRLTSSPLNRQYPVNGWLVWYAQANQELLFWMRDTHENLLIFELNRMRLLSDIITLLPDGNAPSQGLEQAAIRLLNGKDQNLYQWGKYNIPDDNTSPTQQMYLSQPLGNWKLQYYSAVENIGDSQRINLYLGLISLSMVLIVLGIYFYRERNREQREAAQRVNFVNQVSHELKTPLTNIRMYSELSQEFKHDQEKSAKYMDIIVSESLRLSRLIENVLNFSRSQQSKLAINKTPGFIGNCIRKTMKSYEAAWDQHQLAVEFQNNTKQQIYFDHMALEQILNNLFSNAEKYASSGSKILIRADYQENTCFIRVRDYGPGIAENLQEKIFEPFYRISSQLTDGISGTGIGLSISRQLARLHGGDLKLETYPDGCCFIISLNTEEPK